MPKERVYVFETKDSKLTVTYKDKDVIYETSNKNDEIPETKNDFIDEGSSNEY